MREALQGRFEAVYSSDYILDEAVNFALVRKRGHDLAVDIELFILESLQNRENYDQYEPTLRSFRKITKIYG
ncbi:MAG: hypothetical protein QXG44_13525 [Candidatus Jordarchaeaceae archaeon]